MRHSQTRIAQSVIFAITFESGAKAVLQGVLWRPPCMVTQERRVGIGERNVYRAEALSINTHLDRHACEGQQRCEDMLDSMWYS